MRGTTRNVLLFGLPELKFHNSQDEGSHLAIGNVQSSSIYLTQICSKSFD